MTHITALEGNKVTIQTRIVGSFDDMAKMWMLRSICFLAEEPNVKYDEEFGVNDFVATHILAEIDGEPVGIIRIRWFNGYAVLERVGVLRQHRNFRMFKTIARAAVQLAAEKGWQIAVGRARGDTKKLWARWFNAVPSGPDITIDRGTLTPMMFQLPQLPNSMADIPFGSAEAEHVLVQPEGQWDFAALNSARSRVA